MKLLFLVTLIPNGLRTAFNHPLNSKIQKCMIILDTIPRSMTYTLFCVQVKSFRVIWNKIFVLNFLPF